MAVVGALARSSASSDVGWWSRGAVVGVAAAAVVAMVFAAPPSFAAGASLSGNATLTSGQGRSLGGAWDGGGPYEVNFQCGVPGCANFVTSSTAATSLSRYVSRSTCSGETRTHSLKVVARSGSRASVQSQTRWLPGSRC